MKTLYLECGMGAAGDMLTAALLELMPDPDAVVAELNGLGIPGVQFSKEAMRCSITIMSITITHTNMSTPTSIPISMKITSTPMNTAMSTPTNTVMLVTRIITTAVSMILSISSAVT